MRRIPSPFALAILVTLAGCGDDGPAAPPFGPEYVALPSARDLGAAPCAFGQSFTTGSDHPYFPLAVGSHWVLEGEEDGEPVRLRITVLDELEMVGGVATRVVEEAEWEDDELVEVSRNYFAQTPAGDVCYFGEAVDDYEDGEIVSHEGAWRADEPGNFPGVFLPAVPLPGVGFLMEGAPGIAEDEGRIVGSGPVTVPTGRYTNTIRVREFNPLDQEFDFKVFVEGIGTVVDGPLKLTSFSLPGG